MLLEDIEEFAREAGNNIIVAGEFNAKAVDWGMPYTDSKGEATLEMVLKLCLGVVNVVLARGTKRGTTEDVQGYLFIYILTMCLRLASLAPAATEGAAPPWTPAT